MELPTTSRDERFATHTRWLPGVREYPCAEREPGWAHVSGWMQLQRDHRTVSTVVVANDDGPILSQLLPELSDLLTESAHRWEILVVDHGCGTHTESMLAGWCELPGYRALVTDATLPYGSAVTLGLHAARGDAVIVVDCHTPHPYALLSQMIMRWELGQPLLYAGCCAGVSEVCWPDAASPHRDVAPGSGAGLFESRGDLVLLDRDIIRAITR